MDDPTQDAATTPRLPRKYRWPWFVLAAFIAAVLLAMLWLSVEIRRAQRIRELNTPATNNPGAPAHRG